MATFRKSLSSHVLAWGVFMKDTPASGAVRVGNDCAQLCARGRHPVTRAFLAMPGALRDFVQAHAVGVVGLVAACGASVCQCGNRLLNLLSRGMGFGWEASWGPGLVFRALAGVDV